MGTARLDGDGSRMGVTTPAIRVPSELDFFITTVRGQVLVESIGSRKSLPFATIVMSGSAMI
jgi:hypothetical protein